MTDNNGVQTISKYDRLRGGLVGVGMFTKPSTVRNVETISGKAETFVVETCRYEERGGDFIFVECMDETGLTRVALPPKVANAIASQRDRLTTRSRREAARRRAAAMTEEEKEIVRQRFAKARKK